MPEGLGRDRLGFVAEGGRREGYVCGVRLLRKRYSGVDGFEEVDR